MALSTVDARSLTAPRPTPTMTILGVDLGQRQDWTALAIVLKRMETRPVSDRPQEKRLVSTYDVPFLDRVQGASYELICDRIAALKRRPEMTTARLVIDETGVGAAVGDMLNARQLYPERITITGGSTVTRNGKSYTVPKRDLATTVAVMLESRRLQIAAGLPLAPVLRSELENFRVSISLNGHDSYGAGDDWRENNHDDLVLALSLALWFGERMTNRGGLA